MILGNTRSVQATFFVSDHSFVECRLSLLRPNLSVEETYFRKMRQINLEAFKGDITTSEFFSIPWFSLDNNNNNRHLVEK